MPEFHVGFGRFEPLAWSQDGRDAVEVMEALKAEVAKLQEEPKVISVHGPELMAVAEDSPNKRMQVHFVIPSLSVSVKSSKKVI